MWAGCELVGGKLVEDRAHCGLLRLKDGASEGESELYCSVDPARRSIGSRFEAFIGGSWTGSRHGNARIGVTAERHQRH